MYLNIFDRETDGLSFDIIILLVSSSRSHLSGCFCLFAPNFWEGGGDQRMVLFHSMNSDWVVGTREVVRTLKANLL